MYHFLYNVLLILSLTLSILSAEFDYVTVSPGADPSVSAEDGGNGFEDIATSFPDTPFREWPHWIKSISSAASFHSAGNAEKGSKGYNSSPDLIQKYSGDEPMSSISLLLKIPELMRDISRQIELTDDL